MPRRPARSGLSAVEVIVVFAILAILALGLLMTLPRRLEVARGTGCEKNLMHIGVALAIYDQNSRHLPSVTAPGPGGGRGGSPLAALLETLSLPDLREVADAGKPPPRHPGLVVVERPVPGFVCASDPHATAGLFPAPISYRATTGDSPDGSGGAFALGRQIRLAEIEAGDGLAYTSAFSERLVGDRRPAPARENYAVPPGSLPSTGCPTTASDWRGDAGSSWVVADWQSTLYNHALLPNAAPSCIASDDRSAFMGASSGHPDGVRVLMCDGSVKTYTPRVDAAIWRSLGTTHSPAGAAGPAR